MPFRLERQTSSDNYIEVGVFKTRKDIGKYLVDMLGNPNSSFAERTMKYRVVTTS